MINYNWCHGPECHKQHTVDRVRGVKGSKVLRTKKVKVIEPLPRYYQGWENHFCKLGCLMEFIKKHITRTGTHDEKSRYGVSKQGVPYYVYFDLDVWGYRTATTTWKVRH